VSPQDDLYQRVVSEYGAALGRLARGYEADPDKRRDLLQEVHLALWRSFERFQAACSLRTWVYRVAHNTAISWVNRQKRARTKMLVSLEEVEMTPVPPDADRRVALERLMQLIERLEPRDREVILAYLEGMDAAAIGELTGLSARNVATKVHRIMVQLHRRGSARSVPAGVDAKASIVFHRSELERQRDALRTVWRWYLLPFVPGIAATQIAAGMDGGINRAIVITALCSVALFAGVWALNQWGARKLERKIQQLKALEDDNE
jgi:RNA polymerase sigma-70 factor, ECF subfamily